MMELTELVDKYLRIATRIRSAATREHYHRSVRQFSEHLGRPATTDDLNDDALAAYMLEIVDSGLTETTANQRIKQLRAVWNWAAKRRIVDQFPTVANLREPEHQPRAYTLPEVERLFRACREAPGWVGPHKASAWWESLHSFLWDSGERIGAALALMRTHLALDDGLARVPASIRKGGQLSMTYRLRPATVATLRRLLAVPSDTGLVFDRHWRDDKSIYAAYRKIVLAAGLEWSRRETGFQKLRRTVLTHVELLGGDATAFARHSSRRTTEQSYLDAGVLLDRQRCWPVDPVAIPSESPRPSHWWQRVIGRG